MGKTGFEMEESRWTWICSGGQRLMEGKGWLRDDLPCVSMRHLGKQRVLLLSWEGWRRGMDSAVEGLGFRILFWTCGGWDAEGYHIGDWFGALVTHRETKPRINCLQPAVIPPFLLPTQSNVSLYTWIFKQPQCYDLGHWLRLDTEIWNTQAMNSELSQHVTHSEWLGLAGFLFWVIFILRRNSLRQSYGHKITEVIPSMK